MLRELASEQLHNDFHVQGLLSRTKVDLRIHVHSIRVTLQPQPSQNSFATTKYMTVSFQLSPNVHLGRQMQPVRLPCRKRLSYLSHVELAEMIMMDTCKAQYRLLSVQCQPTTIDQHRKVRRASRVHSCSKAQSFHHHHRQLHV